MIKKDIAIFGSTGSIGKMALSIARKYKNFFNVVAISGNNNIDLLAEQIKEFTPKYVSISNAEKYKEFLSKYTNLLDSTVLFSGDNGMLKILDSIKIDILIISVVGITGLKPLYKALDMGINVASANKEPIVVAGDFLLKKSKEKKSFIFPIDSEHSAIFQCLLGEEKKYIKKLIITASGGPFLFTPFQNLKNVKIFDVLNHPKWKMGPKVTIDSATLMNKAFEVIEAKYLFDIEKEKIDVIIHPESIIHSMVEFIDGSYKAELAPTDMKIPIQYAMSYPERLEKTLDIDENLNTLDFKKIKSLNFYNLDINDEKFKCFKLAIESMNSGNDYLIVLNASDEILVNEFLNGRISFLDIPEYLNEILSKHSAVKINSLDDIFELDKKTRKNLLNIIKN